MAKRGHAKKHGAKQPRASEQELQLLAQLKEIAQSIGTEVREEKLVREVGYSVHSGPCRLGGREVVLLDSTADAAERIEVMLDFLASRDLDQIYLEPRIRELIGGRKGSGGTSGTADSV